MRIHVNSKTEFCINFSEEIQRNKITTASTSHDVLHKQCQKLRPFVDPEKLCLRKNQIFRKNTNKKDGYRQRNVCQFLISAQPIVTHNSIYPSNAISLRYILASRGYTPGTIAVNVTWMERGLNACQTHCSMYPSIFNRSPVIQPVSSKVYHFNTFFAHFGLPWVCPWDNRGNVTWMERGFNAGQMHNSIYPSNFNCLRAIVRHWSEIAIFPTPWHLMPLLGVFPLEFREKVWSSENQNHEATSQ